MNWKRLVSSLLVGVLCIGSMAVTAPQKVEAAVGIQSGEVYYFKNVAYPSYALNVMGTNPYGITYARNIALYQFDRSDDMQKWKAINRGSYWELQCAGGLSNFFLDRRTSDITAQDPLNNAQCYTSSVDSHVYFQDAGTNKVKIYQQVGSTKYYLTAVSGTNGDNNKKGPNDPGNVYWATSGSLGNRQVWEYENVNGGSSSGDYTPITFTPVSSSNCQNGFSNELFVNRNLNPLGAPAVEAFVNAYKPYAQQASSISGIPISTILGLWGLESGWGTDSGCVSWQNFGGLGRGGRYDIATSGWLAEYDGIRCFARAWGYWFQDNSAYYPQLTSYLNNTSSPNAYTCARYIANGGYGGTDYDSYYNSVANCMDLASAYL